MDSLIGEIIDNYKIISIIGRGGMGVVFKAMDLSLDKVVALKMLDPGLAKDENFLKRFQTEAKALAKLENPYIVNVYALRETDKGTFIVMKFLNSKNLSVWIKENGAFEWGDALNISKQLLNAIGYAHKVGVIHRDIKPSNIMLSENQKVKITDFGLAKVIRGGISSGTIVQMRAGTLHYMSPEQVKGLQNVDKRSDLYSLGMTIYEMLTGRVPFEKTDSEFTVQKQIVDGKIPSPLKFNSEIPKQFAKIISKATENKPDKRYQSAEEMLSDLNSIETESVEPEPGDDDTRIIVNKKKKKRQGVIYSLFSIIAVLIVLTIFFGEKIFDKPVPDIKDTISTKIITDTIKKKRIGQLDIISVPSNARLYVDNKYEGQTPQLFLPPEFGEYKIKISKEGYKDWTKNVLVKDSVTQFFDPMLTPVKAAENAWLTLNSIPPAEIFINEKKTSGGVEKLLSAGEHQLKFIHPKLGEANFNVTLKKDERKKLICYFRQIVNVQSVDENGIPTWATVFINERNSYKQTATELSLIPGKHNISVRRAGYETLDNPKSVTVSPSFTQKKTPLVFHLQKL